MLILVATTIFCFNCSNDNNAKDNESIAHLNDVGGNSSDAEDNSNNEKLNCNMTTYENFIWSREMIIYLVSQDDKNCDLEDANLLTRR